MKDNSGKIILALLAGASAGVVAGILMAPDTGEVSRDNLKKSASKLGQDLETKLQASMEQLQTLTTSAGALLNKVSGGNMGSGSNVTNTGSNSNPSSHLQNNPTGGNVDAAGSQGNTNLGSKTPTASKGGKGKGAGGGTNATA